MNIYQVVSEELYGSDYVCEDISVPYDYCFAELVVAEKHSQAGFMAWKNDENSFSRYDITERPRMRINIVKKDVGGPARLVTNEEEMQELWRE